MPTIISIPVTKITDSVITHRAVPSGSENAQVSPMNVEESYHGMLLIYAS